MSLTLKDLKEAGYNPRVISDKRLGNLAKSMSTYGDLSGVVFNTRTKTLISGHQRLKTLRMAGIKTKIVTKKVKDNHGTTEEGYILAKTESGELRLPIRLVSWSDKKTEKAANIAANAHGGDFDREKLGALLRDLETSKQFDIDTIGLDPLSLRGLMMKNGVDLPGSKGGAGGGEFQEFDEDSFEFQHTCPKCSFQFNTSAASKSGAGKKPSKQAEAAKATRKKNKDEKDGKKSKKIKGEEKPAKKIKSKKAKVETKPAKKKVKSIKSKKSKT